MRNKKTYQYNFDGSYINWYRSTARAALSNGVSKEAIKKVIDKYPERSSIGYYWASEYFNNLFSEQYVSKYPRRKDANIIKSSGNILIVSDLHEPFTLKDYITFIKELYLEYDIDTVVFIGDLIDNHYSSFHDTNPDGHSAAQEFIKAKKHIQQWYQTFPYAYVITGNHDSIPSRRSFNAGLSSIWTKSLSEILETPTWKYDENFVINDILFTHGTGRKAKQRSVSEMISVVQGHYHSDSYIQFINGINNRIFAMQLGAGFDDKSYAAAYGRFMGKTHVNAGIILSDGTPIIKYM